MNKKNDLLFQLKKLIENKSNRLTKMMIATIISTVLLVSTSGCNETAKDTSGTADSSSSSSGTLMLYNESEVGSKTGLKNPENLRINSKGQLIVYENEGQSGKFISLDENGKVLGSISSDIKGYFISFDLDAQDNIYVVVMESDASGMSQKVYVIDPSGKIVNTFPLEKLQNGSGADILPYARDISVDLNGKIYVATLNGIFVLDKSGKLDKKIGKGSYYSIDTDSASNLIALGIQDGKFSLTKIDSKTGKNIWSNADLKRPESSNANSYKLGYNSLKKCICVMDSYSITSFAEDGKLIEKVLDLKKYTILTSGYSLTAMNIDQKGNIFILTKNNENYELFKYDIQAGVHKAKGRKVITLAVPVSERWLEVAALKFQKVNQDYRVEIKQYKTDEKQAAEGNNENYAKSINTELLTGKGPDIINTSGLPYEKYADKNLLADLGELIQQDKNFDIGSYYKNIFDTMKYKNKLYTLPASVKFSVLTANSKLLENKGISIDDAKWTWQDFNSLGDKLPKDKKMFASMPMKALLDYMLKGSYSNFINEVERKASFDTEEFVNLLKFSKSYGDSSIPANTVIKNANFGDIESIQKGSVIFNTMDISDYSVYAFLKGIYNNQLKLLEFPSVGEYKGGVFDSAALFSINNNSQNKAVAWEFLKYLLSDEIQSGDLNGFAVNKEALAKTARKTIDMLKTGGMVLAVDSKNSKSPTLIEPKELSQKDIDYINSFIEKMSVYNRDNAGVNAIISTEVLPFFSGQKSAEEIARIIQDKVNIYLGE